MSHLFDPRLFNKGWPNHNKCREKMAGGRSFAGGLLQSKQMGLEGTRRNSNFGIVFCWNIALPLDSFAHFWEPIAHFPAPPFLSGGGKHIGTCQRLQGCLAGGMSSKSDPSSPSLGSALNSLACFGSIDNTFLPSSLNHSSNVTLISFSSSLWTTASSLCENCMAPEASIAARCSEMGLVKAALGISTGSMCSFSCSMCWRTAPA